MAEVTVKAAAWLQSVLDRLPAAIRAVYAEYGDAVTPDQEHLVCFNAFGFESLAGGRFDAANPDHVGELGEFTWEPPDECDFRAADHPGTDWLAVLRAAAGSPEVVGLAKARGVQLIVGEHDCAVFRIV
jgi:hypothetical protein